MLDSGDADTIKSATDALMQASMKMGEAMYKQQEQPPAGEANDGASASNAGGKENVVDADFEEVDKTKKTAHPRAGASQEDKAPGGPKLPGAFSK